MTTTNPGLTALLAASAKRTPEERRALSQKAAAASAAKARERKAAKAQAPTTTQETVQAAITAPVEQPSASISFDVCLQTGGTPRWVRVQAGGFQRAMRAARKANPGATVLGALRAGVLKG